MFKAILTLGVFQLILENPVIIAIILGVIGFLAYAYYQGQNKRSEEDTSEDTSLLNWKNPEIRKRIGWFIDPKIFGEFRIDGLTSGEILEARDLIVKFLNYEEGKEKGELREKLSLAEEQRLLLLLNRASVRE